jgi:hypothetical protein
VRDYFIYELQNVLKRKHGQEVELFSREVVLSFEYLDFRTAEGRFIGGPKSFNVGEYLVHELIADEDRMRIFSSAYDLGSRVVLNEKQVRTKAIIDELESPELLSICSSKTMPANIEDILKDLKHVVRDLTATVYRDFVGKCEGSPDAMVNASFATKVLCTLYRFRLEWPKVFGRYAQPSKPGNANMELRDSYALGGYEETPKVGAMIYADLKASLTYGMDADDRDALLPTIERVTDRYANTAFVGAGGFVINEFGVVSGAKEAAMVTKRQVENMLPLGERTLPERLDKSIYVGLAFREIEHRITGKRFVDNFLESPAAKVPLMANWSEEQRNAIFIAMSRRDITGFRTAIRVFTGCNYSDEEFERANDLQIYMQWVVVKPLGQDTRLNPVEAVAALIACIGKEAEKIKLKAYWHGKITTSDRPVHYLEQIKTREDLITIPEFYLEYWFRRYTLVLSRLFGKVDVWRNCNSLEQFEWQRVQQVFATHGFEKACELVNGYYDFRGGSIFN